MSVMRIKRGNSEEWALGPQLVDFSECIVNGKDSTILCEGNIIRMNVFTASAENFSTLTPSIGATTGLEYDKHYGLQIFHHSDFTRIADVTKSHRLAICTKNRLPNGCEVHVCFNGQTQLRLATSSDIGTRYTVTIPANSSTVGIVVSWDRALTSTAYEEIELYLSICCNSNAYDTLLPGQLGCEYVQVSSNTTDTMAFLKVGTPKFAGSSYNYSMGNEDDAKTWDKIPYVGQIIPSAMFGTTLPTTGVHGQIFYLKVT